jgi:sugar phosphate isomerase/epimerase
MGVELGLAPDDRWAIERDALMSVTADAGFAALGMYRRWVDTTARDALASHGLRCDEMVALIVRDDVDRTFLRAQQLAAAAAEVGARWVLTVFDATPTPEIVDVARQCAAVMNDVGASLAVEFTPLGAIDTIDRGLEIITAIGGGTKLVVDSWHVSLGPTTWEDLEVVPLDQIAYVQFDDALPLVTDDLREESTNRRALPGAGFLDLDRFATTLLERGWQGLVTVEVLGAASGLPVRDLVRQCDDSAARYWR